MSNKNTEKQTITSDDVATLPASVFDADGLPTETDPQWEYTEGGRQFEFVDRGDWIQGIVTGKSSIDLTNRNTGEINTVGKYTVDVQKSSDAQLARGDTATFLGGTQIDSAMEKIVLYSIVNIKFEGTVETRDGNRFKQFTIKAARGTRK